MPLILKNEPLWDIHGPTAGFAYNDFCVAQVAKGLGKDEDNGEMSAWYVFNALGFYPLCPGHPSYVLGSPLFKRATVHLSGNRTLVIDTPENSVKHVYVKSVRLNGHEVNRAFVMHDEVMNGGTLIFVMNDQPFDPDWSDDALPYSLSRAEQG